ncbi:hypothetical protein [Streptomyces cellostaticus]|uniref:hypothetical protein n=1 Tax=Streptomyces cellostaticus TaxID=67285 RepID=UPI001FCA49E9|nr:hypothetical protein [Streptomyces cellostaticus]
MTYFEEADMPAGVWTDEMLEQMRQTGDPVGDAAIAETYELGKQEEVGRRCSGSAGTATRCPPACRLGSSGTSSRPPYCPSGPTRS